MRRFPICLKSSRATLVVLGTWGALLAAPAHAFSDDEARKAIITLRQQVAQLSAQLQAAQNTLLDQARQSSQLQQDQATLRGQLEDATHQLSELQRSQHDYYADLDSRLKKFEPQQQTVDGVQGVVQPGEAEAFNSALNLFQKGDFKGAVSAFKEFLNKYPQSPYRPSAMYWEGVAYYGLRDYKNSNFVLRSVVSAYPTHPRAADALAAIAGNEAEMGQKAASQKTLQQLRTQYPDSDAARKAAGAQ